MDTVMFVHGHPLDGRVWGPQAEAAAAAGYRVLSPALRGYRDGPRAGPVVTIADHADDLAAVVGRAVGGVGGVGGIAVVGVSMGGQIALELYRRHPGSVVALVLCGTTAAGETAQGRADRLAQAERLERDGMVGHTHRTLPLMVGPATSSDTQDLVRDMMLRTPARGAAASQRGRADRADLRPLLPRIAVPTLVLVGDDDPYVPVEQAALMAARIPGAALRVIAGAAHLPSLEQPAATTDALLGHLARVGEPLRAGACS